MERGDQREPLAQAALRQERKVDEDRTHLERDAAALKVGEPVRRERVRLPVPARAERELEQQVVVSVDDRRTRLLDSLSRSVETTDLVRPIADRGARQRDAHAVFGGARFLQGEPRALPASSVDNEEGLKCCGSVAVALGGLGAVVAVIADRGAVAAGVSSGSSQKTVRLAFFNPIVANAFTASQYRGIKLSAGKAKATVTQFDAGFDQNKQIRQIQDAIVSKKFDAFVITPVNGAVLVKPTEDAIKAGIKVVAIFNGIGPDLDSIKPQVKGISSVIGQRLSVNGTLHRPVDRQRLREQEPL